jgi:hypothetical protein
MEELHGKVMHYIKCWEKRKLDKCMAWDCFQFLNKFMVEEHHFKDINIVSQDGSSSDVETHMLEEIRQLKEHSRMQEKVIEELKNNRRHHENQEATMVTIYILICNSILKCVT